MGNSGTEYSTRRNGHNHTDILVRKARLGDAEQIASLINHFAAQGLMLPKNILEVYEHIREYVVAEDETGRIVGCGALRLMWHDLGEIRSLAVAEEAQGRGVGRRIVEMLLEEARELGLACVFALTYQVPFFEKLGFRVVPKAIFPQKVWLDCQLCPKRHCCDETAMILVLDEERAEAGSKEWARFTFEGVGVGDRVEAVI